MPDHRRYQDGNHANPLPPLSAMDFLVMARSGKIRPNRGAESFKPDWQPSPHRAMPVDRLRQLAAALFSLWFALRAGHRIG